MTVYGSKIDAWLVAVFAFAIAVSLYTAFNAASTGSSGIWPTVLFSIALGVCLPLWLLSATSYTLDAESLKVACGPLRWTISLRDITSIRPTFNPLASPALSLDRLRIEYGNGRVILISPRDKDTFVRELEAHRASAA